MSTSYYIYTEVEVDGKWICINNKLKNVEKGSDITCETYYSGSRSYFQETAYKIEEIGYFIQHKDLSEGVKKLFKYSEEHKGYWRAFSFSPKDMYACFPKNSSLKEHCGYVHKDTIFNCEAGEIDDIYEWFSADEYLAFPEEKKKCYEYYEWNSEDGWYKHFKEILEHFYWQRYEWNSANYCSEKDHNFRLILIVC